MPVHPSATNGITSIMCTFLASLAVPRYSWETLPSLTDVAAIGRGFRTPCMGVGTSQANTSHPHGKPS